MINPRTMAKAAAYADIATQSANLQQQQAELNAESSGLDSLSTALIPQNIRSRTSCVTCAMHASS